MKLFLKVIGLLTIFIISLSFYACEEDENNVQDDIDNSINDENNSDINDDYSIHTHVYETIITEPTCEMDGYVTHKCLCGDLYTEVYMSKIGHIYMPYVIDPTCIKDGYTFYKCNCGDSYTANYIKTEGHKYEVLKIEATCTESGYSLYECFCGASYKDSLVEATGHDFIEEVISPTCESEGYTLHACACGESYKEEYTKSKGHTYTTLIVEPTCTASGYTLHTCACGDSYNDNYVDATGHSCYGYEIIDSTCTERGYLKGKCYICNTDIIEYMPAKGHDYNYTICKSLYYSSEVLEEESVYVEYNISCTNEDCTFSELHSEYITKTKCISFILKDSSCAYEGSVTARLLIKNKLKDYSKAEYDSGGNIITIAYCDLSIDVIATIPMIAHTEYVEGNDITYTWIDSEITTEIMNGKEYEVISEYSCVGYLCKRCNKKILLSRVLISKDYL